jgi:hypothetical protein
MQAIKIKQAATFEGDSANARRNSRSKPLLSADKVANGLRQSERCGLIGNESPLE